MSKELNIRGAIVGSARYFMDINSSEVISEITSNLTEYRYYDFIKALEGKIQYVVEDIYRDLSRSPRILRFVIKNDRDRLLKFVLNLDDLLRYSGVAITKYPIAKLSYHYQTQTQN